MTREIKFRGKCIEHTMKKPCGFVFGYLIISGENYSILGEWESGKGHLKCVIDKETVGQYTGLKDKNGKEIYESDVLAHINGDKSVMRWIDDYACFAGVLSLENTHQYYQRIDEKKLEVIGNIYENPDLLTPTES